MSRLRLFDFALFAPNKLWLYGRNLPLLLAGTKPFSVTVGDTNLFLRPRTMDLYVLAENFKDESYDISNRLTQKLVHGQKINTVVDLGANIGFFSLWAAKKFTPKKIVCVEMDHDNFSILKRNISSNPHLKAKFTLLNLAIHAKTTTVNYEVGRVNRGLHTIVEEKTGNSIKTVTLKNLLKKTNTKTVDLLKIDIEGTEKLLLNKENEGIFKNNVSRIVMEVHEEGDFSITFVENYLKKLGFTCFVEKNWSMPNPLILAEGPVSGKKH